MSRSIWKGPFSSKNLFQLKNQSFFSQKAKEIKNIYKPDKTVFVWSRNAMILPEFIGRNIQIYNGNSWARRKVVEEMVGHKFGEFCSTKKKTIHKTTKLKQASRKKK